MEGATPSARSAGRQAALRQSAASQLALSGILQTPATSARAVLDDLEGHLAASLQKQANWRSIGGGGGGGGEGGEPQREGRSIDMLHLTLMRSELRELEHEAEHGAAARWRDEAAGLRDSLEAARARASATEGSLQLQVAEQVSSSWRLKEELAAAREAAAS